MATNGIGWCVEAYGVNGWQQLSATVPTKAEAEAALPYWSRGTFETRVYEVLA